MTNREYGKIIIENKEQEAWININKDEIFIETSFSIFKDQVWKVINGSFNGLDNVTLINSRSGSGSSGAGGSWRKIRAGSFLKGIHFDTYENIIFKSANFSCPNLTSWFVVSDKIEVENKHNFKTPDDIDILKFEGNEIVISIRTGYGYSHEFQKLSIENNCALLIESTSGIHIDSLSKLLQQIKKFFLFLINKNIIFQDYILKTINDERCELINIEHQLNEDKFSMVFDLRFRDIESEIEGMFQTWIENPELELIFDLVLERCYNPELSFQGYFFNMCVAIENYSNNLNKVDNDEKVKENTMKRKIILELIEDKTLRDWFGSKSSYWKKKDFRDKISYFDESIKVISNSIFPYTIDELKTRIIETRNKIAHEGIYDEHFTSIELLLVGKLLEFNIKIELMVVLGLPSSKADEFRERANHNLKLLAKLNKYE